MFLNPDRSLDESSFLVEVGSFLLVGNMAASLFLTLEHLDKKKGLVNKPETRNVVS